MKLGVWPNRRKNWRKNASPPLRGPFRLTCAERYSNGNPHWAMDIAPIPWRYAKLRAVRDGVILACHDGESDNPPRRYSGMPSNWIILGWTNSKGQKRSAFYQHLRKGSVRVKPGQKVKAGVVIAGKQKPFGKWIGRMGTSGNTTGLHLHFSVHKGWINPSQRYNQMYDSNRIWPPSKVWLKPKKKR
jgi:murein DD-endopeptidase MepM/ murein hydrolase activator NlpD